MNKFTTLFSILALTSVANATENTWFDDAQQLTPQAVEKTPDPVAEQKHEAVTSSPNLIDACKHRTFTQRIPDANDTTADGFSVAISYSCFDDNCYVKKTPRGNDNVEANFFRTDKTFYGAQASRWLELSQDIAGVQAVSNENVAHAYANRCYAQVVASVTCGKAANQCIVTVTVK
jgi:hypothetical protein